MEASALSGEVREAMLILSSQKAVPAVAILIPMTKPYDVSHVPGKPESTGHSWSAIA